MAELRENQHTLAHYRNGVELANLCTTAAMGTKRFVYLRDKNPHLFLFPPNRVEEEVGKKNPVLVNRLMKKIRNFEGTFN